MDYVNDFCLRYDEAWACGYAEFFENADLCDRFYRGDQISSDDIAKAEASGRILRAFNHLCPKLHALSGLLQGTDYRAVPNVEHGSEELRNIISLKDKTLDYIQSSHDFMNAIHSAMHEAISITGLSLVCIDKVFDTDSLSGDLEFSHLRTKQFIIDPLFTNDDLSDCQFILTREYLNRADLESRYKDRLPQNLLDKAEESASIFFFSDIRDARFSFLFDLESESRTGRLCVDFMYYREVGKMPFLVDYVSGQSFPWHFSEDDMNNFLYNNGTFSVEYRDASFVKKAVFANGIHITTVDDFGMPNKTMMPFVAVKAKFNNYAYDMSNRFNSLTLDAIPAQRCLNETLSTIANISQSQSNSGWIYLSGAVEPANLMRSGAGNLIPVATGQGGLDSIRPIQPTPIDPSLQTNVEELKKQIDSCIGNLDAIVGQNQSGNDTGYLLNVKKELSSLGFKFLITNLKNSLLALSIKALDAFRSYERSKVCRILSTNVPDEYFNEALPGGVKININEVVTSNSAKREVFGQLLELRAATGESSPITTDILIKFAPLRFEKDVLDAIKDAERERVESSREMRRIELEDAKSLVAVKRSIAEANSSMSKERLSRASKNIQDSEAEEMISDSKAAGQTLENVQKLVEIEAAMNTLKMNKIVSLKDILDLKSQVDMMADDAKKREIQNKSSSAIEKIDDIDSINSSDESESSAPSNNDGQGDDSINNNEER